MWSCPGRDSILVRMPAVFRATQARTDSFNYVGDPTLNSSCSSTGLIGGAQAGYNVQSGHIVFGAEGDIGYLGISGSRLVLHSLTNREHNKDWNTYGRRGHCTISGTYSTPAVYMATLLAASATRRIECFLCQGRRRVLERRHQGKLFTGVDCSLCNTQGCLYVQFRPQRNA